MKAISLKNLITMLGRYELTCNTFERSEEISSKESPVNESELWTWNGKDSKALAIIGLAFSDELLGNVREVKTYKAMGVAIKNIFERHTLLRNCQLNVS